MAWFSEIYMRELVLLCPGGLAESLSDALLQAGALSVSVEDADLDTDAEQPLFGEPGSEPNTQAWTRNHLVYCLPMGRILSSCWLQRFRMLSLPLTYPDICARFLMQTGCV